MIPKNKYPFNSHSKNVDVLAKLIDAHNGRIVLYRDLTIESQMAIAHYMAIDGEAWDTTRELENAFEKHRSRFPSAKATASKLATKAWAETFAKFIPYYVKKYGHLDFGYVEIPTTVLCDTILKHNPDLKEYFSFTSYHKTYDARGYKHQATSDKPWPVILHCEDILQDGWNRFHQYVKRKLPTVPAVWYPHKQNLK